MKKTFVTLPLAVWSLCSFTAFDGDELKECLRDDRRVEVQVR
jgi:hypothetical protein